MTRAKRTYDQLAFDYTKHGWAFCNQQMLRTKVERLEELAEKLPKTDPRHQDLILIKSHLHPVDK